MARTIVTHEDAGKPVVAPDGERIGTITAVTRGGAHVDPDPGLTEATRSVLTFGLVSGRERYRLQEAAIDEITDDEVWLKR